MQFLKLIKHNKDDVMKLKTLALTAITSSTLVMTACAGPNAYNNMSNTAKGATAGAAAGALIRSKGDSKDIARGALAGAALGGGAGYVIDQQQ